MSYNKEYYAGKKKKLEIKFQNQAQQYLNEFITLGGKAQNILKELQADFQELLKEEQESLKQTKEQEKPKEKRKKPKK